MTDLDSRSDDTPPPEPPPRHAEGETVGSSGLRLAMLAAVVVLAGIAGGFPILLMIFALVVMIFLHELGHYLTAKAAGMKVTEFFIGFGPRIWSFHRGETEYGIKAIPAGAYVKVIGMTQLEEVDPSEEDRTYRSKPYWRRMSVAVAGSTMHFALALVALAIFFATAGMTQEDNWNVGRMADPAGGEASPAAVAGIEVGDEIRSFDGVAVVTWDDMREAILAREVGDTVTVVVDRAGETVAVDVTLGENPDGGPFLGIGPEYPTVSMAPHTAVVESVKEFGTISVLTVEAITQVFSPSGLANLLGLAADTARTPADTGAEPGGTPATPQASDPDDSRVVSIVGVVALGADVFREDPLAALALFALVNIFIGIFNLIPLLPLDGGHVAIATYEKGRELFSRSRDRYYADVGKLIPLTYGVIFVLVGVGLVALYLDIADPIRL